MRRPRQSVWSAVALGVVLCSALAWLSQGVQAAPAAPSARTPLSGTQTAEAALTQAAGAPTPARETGAYIVLRVPNARASTWTGVQWQDGHGAWHDVTGWQGQVYDGERTWWVAPEYFGAGPFRWVVVMEPGQTAPIVSESFSLPTALGQRVIVVLAAEAEAN